MQNHPNQMMTLAKGLGIDSAKLTIENKII